jgi:hypothetical protein
VNQVIHIYDVYTRVIHLRLHLVLDRFFAEATLKPVFVFVFYSCLWFQCIFLFNTQRLKIRRTSVKIALMCGNQTRACENRILRVEITLERVEITNVRV